MIPKIVHYIWFGRNPYPEDVVRCINTWKEKLPDYEFRLWNEDNFDVHSCKFTEEAYANKKWAFVSDYVRLFVLFQYGGWYLDTDIEVVRSFAPLENNRMVFGTDEEGFLAALIGSEKQHPFLKRMLSVYQNMNFVLNDGKLNMEVINTYLQNELKNYGYQQLNKYQELTEGICVYPDDYFEVVSLTTGKSHQTQNTYAIHWHTLLWVSKKTRIIRFIRMKILAPILGRERYTKYASFMKSLWKRK